VSSHTGSAAGPCRNCGTPPPPQTPPPRYCAQCGQETALHPPSFGEFVHEFVGHYVALEGALWRSLGLLLARPGRLTREYLAGRRRRYVLPLRLYLSASFLFFLVLKLAPATVDDLSAIDRRGPPAAEAAADEDDDAPAAAAPSSAEPASAAASRELMVSDCGTPGHQACTGLERWLDRLVRRANADPQGFMQHLGAQTLALAPYAVFLLQPVFAALMLLAYRNRRMTYGEHFVFSLHLHAFWFLAMLAAALLPEAVSELPVLAMPVYGVWAMRAVYGGRWGATLGRVVLVSVLYGAALLAATLLLLGALLAKV